MSDLAAFQRRFADTLLSGRSGHPGLAVYRNTTAKGAIDALGANYPTIARIVGEAAFSTLAADYVAIAPPDSPVLASYGAGFCEWLESQTIGQALKYLSAVAQIDRLRTESHLAADADILDPSSLAADTTQSWAGHAAALHPATRFTWFTVPAPSIWLAHLDGQNEAAAPAWRSEGVLLTRPAGAVLAERIGPADHRFLFGLRLGETIAQTAGATATLYPDADIAAVFRRILASGALSSLKKRI